MRHHKEWASFASKTGFIFCFSLLFLPLYLQGQVCNCTENIYLNVPSTGHIEKFAITPAGQANAGTLTVVDDGMGNSWYNGSDLPSPHGLAADLNGFLYVGENLSGGDIRRMTCDGELLDESDWVFNSGGQLNIQSIGNILYFNNEPGDNNKWFEGDIMAYNTCTDAVEGAVEFCEADVSYDWGFYIDPRTKRMYATHAGGNDLPKYFWTFTEADFDQDLMTCVSATTLANYPTDNNPMRGITTDTDGNVYISRSGRATENYILKYSPYPDFNYIGQSATDDNNGDGSGWAQMIGIVYSETSNLLYTSSTSSTEDCVSVFDLDLNNIPSLSVPQPANNVGGKAIAILTECCPSPLTQTIDQTFCADSINQKLYLNELFPCDGIICGAEWTPDPNNTGISYEPCDQSITITGAEACATFTKMGTNVQCGTFNLTYNLDVLTTPDVSVTGAGTICPDNPSLDLTASSTTAGVTYQWQSSSDGCDGTWSDIGGATSATYTVTGITADTDYRVLTTLTGACSSGACVDTSACVMVGYEAVCSVCDCTEYIYLNERNEGAVHKFAVSSDGSLTEINPSGPWYPNGGTSELPSPHGLGVDLNGFLYVAENWFDPNADIRKLDCDGNIFSEAQFQLNAQAFNITSVNGILIYNQVGGGLTGNSDDTSIEGYDPCTNLSIGAACFLDDQGNPVSSRWGLWKAPDESLWAYAIQGGDFIYKFSIDDIGSGNCISPLVSGAAGDMFTRDRNNVRGIATDSDGFIYLVNADDFGGPALLTKVDPNTGNVIAETPLDDTENDGGYYGMIGIVYSQDCDCIYSANYTETDDCVTKFSLDLQTIEAAVGPTGGDPSNNTQAIGGKAIGVVYECCPSPLTQTIDQTFCADSINQKLYLNELFPCDGIVCGAEWTPDAGNTGISYDPCDQSITVTGAEACATFTKMGTNVQCGTFNLTYNLDVLTTPEVSVTGAGTICPDNPTLDLTASSTTAGVTYQWQISDTDCNGTWSDIGGATSATYTVSGITADTDYRVLTTLTGACSSGACVDTSACVMVEYEAECSICNCVEYIYANDPDLGEVHKIAISSDGLTLTEVGSPWYGGTELPSPHGLGFDLNGFLYIGELAGGDIRKLDCDGSIFPATGSPDAFEIPAGGYNFSSKDNILYINRAGHDEPDGIYAYNLCDGSEIGYICLNDVPQNGSGGWGDWGFKIHENTFFMTSDYNNPSFTQKLWVIEPEMSDFINHTCYDATFDESNSDLDPTYNTIVGVDSDGDHIYIAYRSEPDRSKSKIQKLDFNGNEVGFIEETDPTATFFNTINLTYADGAGYLYAGGQGDCIAIIDPTDMTYAGDGGLGPQLPGTETKGVNIIKECCPSPLTQTIDQTICADSINQVLFLNEIFPCDGIICGAEWTPDAGNTGITYEPCDQSITITGAEACATFTKMGTNIQCGTYNLTYNLDVLINTAPVISGTSPTCATGNDPVALSIDTPAAGNGLTYTWQSSTTDCTTGWTDIVGAPTDGTAYDPPALSQETYYRVLTNVSGTCSSGMCVDTSNCVTLTPESDCENCSCNDMIYLNDTDGANNVHKFRIEGDGSASEIGNPWLPTGNINDPHGLGIDLNGFLYIGQPGARLNSGSDFVFDGDATSDIFKLNCSGTVIDGDFVQIRPWNANFSSYKGHLFVPNSESETIDAYDLCTGSYAGSMNVNGGADVFNWGFYINEAEGNWYYPDAVSGDVIRGSADITLFSDPPTATGAALFDVGFTPNITNDMPMGITKDDAGNYYLIRNNISGGANARIRKYDANGNFLMQINDNSNTQRMNDGEQGFYGARGIVYSSMSGYLYVSALDNCLAVFDTNLNELTQYNIGNPGGTRPKGLGIITECCPNITPLNFSETICSNGQGEKVYLQELLNCGEGTICEGMWMVETANANQFFDNCDLSITINGSGCGTYVLEKTTAASGVEQCGAFRIELEVCTQVPTANLNSSPGSCMGTTPNSDATINGTVINADQANISMGNTYTGPAYGDASNLDVSGGNFTRTNLMHNTEYTIRFWNGSDACFVDEVITTATINCAVCALTVTQSNQNPCQDNGTIPDETDDYFTIGVNATATDGGTQYQAVLNANPDGTGGTVLGTANYGTALTLGDGANGATGTFAADGSSTYAITLRDATNNTCHDEFTTTPVADCAVPCPTITNPTPSPTICEGETVPVLSVNTTATSPDQIEFVYFTTQQSGNAMYTGGTSLAIVSPTAGSASISNVGFPAAGTYYVYAILSPMPMDANCRPVQEIQVTVNAAPDITLQVSDTTVCDFTDALPLLFNSEIGVNYFLRNDANDAIVDGPIVGDGSTINFELMDLTPAGVYTYNVLATTGDGCSAELTDKAVITVQPCDFQDFLPSCDIPACHFTSTDIYLGSGVSSEAQTSGNDGADSDNDDGAIFPNNIRPDIEIRIPVTIYNNTGQTAYLSAWIDWNGDGDFEDAGEQIATESYPAVAPNVGTFVVSLPTTVPADAVQSADIGVRFRLSTDDSIQFAPCGIQTCAGDGEVEDYIIQVECPPTICLPAQISINRE